jgi:hypothetical protein
MSVFPLAVIGFSGRAQVGKDTLCNHFTKMDSRIMRYAFADELKAVYCERAYITRSELERDKELHRQGLINLAELELKVGRPGYFGEKFVERAISGKFVGKLVIITDFRYPAETKEVMNFCTREQVPFKLIRILRPSVSIKECGWSISHLKHDDVYINSIKFHVDHNPATFQMWKNHFCPILYKNIPETYGNI